MKMRLGEEIEDIQEEKFFFERKSRTSGRGGKGDRGNKSGRGRKDDHGNKGGKGDYGNRGSRDSKGKYGEKGQKKPFKGGALGSVKSKDVRRDGSYDRRDTGRNNRYG